MKLTRNYRNMNKGKAKKNTKGNKRYTKRRDNGRKNMNITGKRKTRNLRKKRRNVTRRRGRKILGGDPPNYIEEYLLSETDKDTSYINKNDGRTYVKVNDFGDIRNNEILDKLLKNKYFFVDYLDELDNHGKKLELGYYQGLLMDPKLKNATVFINDPQLSDFLTFKTRDGTQQNIPRTDLYINENRMMGMDNVAFFNSNIIDKLYYYPLTTKIKSGIDSFRKILPNYPTFSFGISSNKDNDDIVETKPPRDRTYTDSTADSSTASDTTEKTYKLITTIDDMKEKIEGRYSFAKLDGNGNYIDYSLCRVSRRNDDEILCDYVNEKGQDETDTITVEDIDNKKIFYLEK